VLEQKLLAAGLVLATRRVEFSRNEDLSCVMQDDTDPNQRSLDWYLKVARQLKQSFSRLANKRDVPQEAWWSAQSRKQKIGVFNRSRNERHALARPTYWRSAAGARGSEATDKPVCCNA
jgi:hypothetical protein